MSNRYLDEAGKVIASEKIGVFSHYDALRFFKLMGIKEITTARQKKNGTTVYELPIRKLSYTGNSYAYRYAIYDSGYIRDVSEHCNSPWYINKRYETKAKYWNSYYKKYLTYTSNKPVFINNFNDQLVYLANYILKNRYGKLYSCCDFNIEQMKECSGYRNKAIGQPNSRGWITRDEYNDWLDRRRDNIQVIVNGTRYNLS